MLVLQRRTVAGFDEESWVVSCGNDVGDAGVSSMICTVTKKSRSKTFTVASSFVCPSPLAVMTVALFLDTRNSVQFR